jgi:hypothetical protein
MPSRGRGLLVACLVSFWGLACDPIRLPAVVQREAVEAGAVDGGLPPYAPDAAPPLPAASRCRAGVFRGHMHGSYRSEPAGLCGVTAGPEEVLDFDVVFELVEQRDQEFYAVRGGCMRVPGEAVRSSESDGAYGLTFELTGTVDCNTGAAAFQLRGTYLSTSVCTLGAGWARYFTVGWVDGRFDPETDSFVDGAWTLRERVASAGGSGVFSAALAPDAGLPSAVYDAGQTSTAQGGDCLGVVVPGDLEPQPAPAPSSP